MTLRVIFDESHGELISINNCRGIEYVFEKLKIVSFRLVSAPITIDKITNEDVLFLGAPTRKFLDFEIKTVKYFISKGKFLVIICPVPIPLNFDLNILVRNFGMEFEHNFVQDNKHNLGNAIFFPIISHFEEDLITKDVKEIVYSGCSIKKLSHDVKILASADAHAEPSSAPILATSENGHVICIGGSNIFEDDKRTGIKAKNNIRLVANLFRAIIHRLEQQEEEGSISTKKLKPMDPKKAKKYFEKLTHEAINDLNQIDDEVDDIFETIVKMIEIQSFSKAEEILESRYKKFKNEIETIYQNLIKKQEEIESRIPKSIDFPTLIKEFADQVLVVESETLSKLDMIRFNLSNRISKEKLRY